MTTNPLPNFTKWIPENACLEGHGIRLQPLQFSHFERLVELGNDARIWANFPSNRQDPVRHFQHLSDTLVDMKNGRTHAFVVQTIDNQEIAGLTRLFHLNQQSRQCEVGSWLAPAFWGCGINSAAKLLLLGFCFENLKTVRVQFRTDANNDRSRRALLKLGARLEGTLRKERIRDDGTTRDALIFSILDDEWPLVRENLREQLFRYNSELVPSASRPTEVVVSADKSLIFNAEDVPFANNYFTQT